ncbi:hypothetical protein ACFL1B_00530 [Nanoarchaeota archaeon]
MKCVVCSKQVETTFLGKPIGTYVKDSKHKKKAVCQECQKAKSMDEIRKKIS